MAIGRAAAASTLLATALGVSAPAQGRVWVVSQVPAPGVDFSQISHAVHSASSGDLVLVKSGIYVPFTLTGKSLSVIADVGASVHVQASQASVLVDGTGLGAEHRVVLQGLFLDGWPPSYWVLPPLRLTASDGSIWLDRCASRGGATDSFIGYTTGEDALLIASCASVVIARSSFDGGNGGKGDAAGEAGDGGHGIEVSSSILSAFDIAVEGGNGGFEPIYVSSTPIGGDALRLAATQAFASGSRFTAGNGGSYICFQGGAGGDGVSLASGSSGAFLGCAAQGGAGGVSPLGCGTSGPDGADFLDAGGSHVLHPGPPRTLAFESPLREGQSSTLTVTGTPGELVMLLVSSQPGRFEHPAVLGPVLVALPASSIPLGAIPASGSTSFGFTVQELGAGVESALVFLQPVLIGASGSIAVGTPAPLVLLDAGL